MGRRWRASNISALSPVSRTLFIDFSARLHAWKWGLSETGPKKFVMAMMTYPTVASFLKSWARPGDGVVNSVIGISTPKFMCKLAVRRHTWSDDSQNTFELAAWAGQEKQIWATEVSVERRVGCATRNKGLVYRGVLNIPIKPVLAAGP